MKLQIALDDITIENAKKLITNVADFIDIIEVGTPFIYEYGMQAVRELKHTFPDKELIADMKIMDGGYYETMQAIKAGADYISILGVTDNKTIKDSVMACNEHGREIVVDMICVNNMQNRISELEDLGVHGLAVHVGTDQQLLGRTPLDDLALLKKTAKKAKISVAGGITLQTIDEYIKLKPDVIIIGSGLTKSENPRNEAMQIKEKIGAYK